MERFKITRTTSSLLWLLLVVKLSFCFFFLFFTRLQSQGEELALQQSSRHSKIHATSGSPPPRLQLERYCMLSCDNRPLRVTIFAFQKASRICALVLSSIWITGWWRGRWHGEKLGLCMASASSSSTLYHWHWFEFLELCYHSCRNWFLLVCR